VARTKKITLKLYATGTPTALKTLLIMIAGVTNPSWGLLDLQRYRFRADIQVEDNSGKKGALKNTTYLTAFKQIDEIIGGF
jgi:hypothetical protein